MSWNGESNAVPHQQNRLTPKHRPQKIHRPRHHQRQDENRPRRAHNRQRLRGRRAAVPDDGERGEQPAEASERLPGLPPRDDASADAHCRDDRRVLRGQRGAGRREQELQAGGGGPGRGDDQGARRAVSADGAGADRAVRGVLPGRERVHQEAAAQDDGLRCDAGEGAEADGQAG